MTREELHTVLSEQLPKLLEAYDLPKAEQELRYAPGKWTCRQLLAHLADAEFVYLWRVCRGLAEPGATVYGFDQDQWAEKLGYSERPLNVCKKLFDGARRTVLELLARADDAALDNTVTHSERGPLSVRQLLEIVLWHADHHLEQVAAARAGRVWTPES